MSNQNRKLSAKTSARVSLASRKLSGPEYEEVMLWKGIPECGHIPVMPSCCPWLPGTLGRTPFPGSPGTVVLPRWPGTAPLFGNPGTVVLLERPRSVPFPGMPETVVLPGNPCTIVFAAPAFSVPALPVDGEGKGPVIGVTIGVILPTCVKVVGMSASRASSFAVYTKKIKRSPVREIKINN